MASRRNLTYCSFEAIFLNFSVNKDIFELYCAFSKDSWDVLFSKFISKLNKFFGCSFNVMQIFSIVLYDGKCSPVSILDNCLGCISINSASFSCVMFLDFLIK